MKSDDELKTNEPELYKVAREKGTEKPFSGEYVNTKADGFYHCVVCGAKLFSSETKFDSATGWPSFTDPVNSQAVELNEDESHGMKRTEVACKTCGAHLGHVFPDGPKKGVQTCDRYCVNSVSLVLKNE